MFNEIIISVISYIDDISGGNQLLAAAIMATLSAVLSGAVGIILWKFPMWAFRASRLQFVTVFEIGTHQYQSGEVYHNLENLIFRNRFKNLSRNISVTSRWIDTNDGSHRDHLYGLGCGWHVFLYNLRLYVAYKYRVDGTTQPTDHITLYSLGRSVKRITSIIDSCIPVIKPDTIRLYNYGKEGWEVSSTIVPSGIEKLALSDDVRDFFTTEIEFYLNNRQRYYDMGLPWKQTFMLHGKPGTGKTSIIRALAATYGLNVCVANLSSLSTDGLNKAIAKIPPKSILLFEDCDGVGATASRDSGNRVSSENDEDKPSDHISILDSLGVDLPGLLNALDGIVPLDDVIVFMTTNHINRIDDAILREGRTDHVIELPELSAEVVNLYLNEIYGVSDFNVKSPMLACQLNGIKSQAKMDVDLARKIAHGELDEHTWRLASGKTIN